MENIANTLIKNTKNINLVYAFNGTGKTRLSIAHKNATKASNNGTHVGVYYNAYSEDLFVWDNDIDNGEIDIKLILKKCSLNDFHSGIDELKVHEKLAPFKPQFDFRFEYFPNREEGINIIRFHLKANNNIVTEEEENNDEEEKEINFTDSIKISRGEQQAFIWSFFLALFDVEDLTGDGKQEGHFFIDDPVSSLDDHNIFVTISSLMDLVDKYYKTRKIIITTHHIGFFSIFADWLTRGEKANKYDNQVDFFKLKKNNGNIELVGPRREVFLYHLELLKTIKEAIDSDSIMVYHFAILRQILENIASFLGVRNFSHVLKEIGITDADKLAQIINIMSHKTVFRYEFKEPVEDNKQDIIRIFNGIQTKYNFVLHI
tara:strand:- start:3831 stop:4955 length:1125 start_codon:yes stop_codon:yes gene_type:complete